MSQNKTNILEEILTTTEWDVARQVAFGHSEKEIADIMCVSPKTVHAHTYNIRKKTGSRSAVDIARKVILSFDNPHKHFLGAIAIAASVIFTTNLNIRKMETLQTVEQHQAVSHSIVKMMIESMQDINLTTGEHTDVEIRTDGYLLIFDCNVGATLSYYKSASYEQPEEFDIEQTIEVFSLDVTDMDYNDVTMSAYQIEKLKQAVSNHIISE